MLNFNHVHYFHVAASEGSIAKAAERLKVTQPTVSEQIRQLERAFGVDLFERTHVGLRLTEHGRSAYQHTTEMFRAGERLVEAVGKPAAITPHTLRIGISAAVSRAIATDFLMPVLTLDACLPVISTGNLTDLVRELHGFELDLVLCETQPIPSATRGMRVVRVHQPTLIAIASPTLIDVDGPLPWNDLPLIHYRASSAYRWEVDAFLDELGVRPRVIAELDDTLLMLEAAARGACVAFVPRSVARDAIAAGRVRQVASLEPSAASVHALHHDPESSGLIRRAVERLTAYALETFER